METDLAVGRVAEDSRITFGSHVCVKDGDGKSRCKSLIM